MLGMVTVGGQLCSGVATTVHSPPKQAPAGAQKPEPWKIWKGGTQLVHDPTVDDALQAAQLKSAQPTVNCHGPPLTTVPSDVIVSTAQQYTLPGVNNVLGVNMFVALDCNMPAEGISLSAHVPLAP
jgi:hypothetical protein